MLWKSVFPHEYMNNWKKFNESSLPEKEDFYSHLNMIDNTDAGYVNTKRVCNDFERKSSGGYHDFYVQNNTLLLADVFENFQIMCLEKNELDLWPFLNALGLAWQAALKNIKVKLDLLIDIDDVINGRKKVSKEQNVKLFINLQKLIKNTWKIMIKV